VSLFQTQGDAYVPPNQLGQPFGVAITPTAVTAAATVQAVATLAAGATGVKHVCYGIIASIACGATAQTPIEIQLLDGASVIARAEVSAPANSCAVVQLSNLHIPGSAATAMKLQFGGTGVAASIQSVTLLTYDVA